MVGDAELDILYKFRIHRASSTHAKSQQSVMQWVTFQGAYLTCHTQTGRLPHREFNPLVVANKWELMSVRVKHSKCVVA